MPARDRSDPPLPAPAEPSSLEAVAWPSGLARPVEVTRLSGGWVGTSSRAVLSDRQVVLVKQTPYPAEAEADGLRALVAAGVPCPTVVGVAEHVLVLAFVGDDVPPPRAGEWATLGRAVAGMHQCAGARFGWHRDNHAGRFPQRNPWTEHWPTFFVDHRVRLHLDDPTVPRELARRIERACDGPIPARLPDHPTPVLTHGDLWRGNIVAGRWVVDPEVSCADRELDLAYMHQSSRNPLPDAFWGGYREVAPLPDGYEERRRVLELHHRLLQVRHFGASQVAELDELLTEQGW